MIKIVYEWIMQLLIKMYNKSINKKIIPKKKKKKVGGSAILDTSEINL